MVHLRIFGDKRFRNALPSLILPLDPRLTFSVFTTCANDAKGHERHQEVERALREAKSELGGSESLSRIMEILRRKLK